MAKKTKRKVSASTRARLKALRRKYGLGEFKNNVKRRSRRHRRNSGVKIRYRSVETMKRRRHSRRGRASGFGGLPVMNILSLGAGAGLAGVGAAYANKVSGGKLSGPVATAAAGLAVHYAGKKFLHNQLVANVGTGMMVAAVGDFVEKNVAPQLMNSTGSMGGSEYI